MTHRYRRRSRRSRLSRTTGAFLPSLALILVGSAGFYGAMNWFRGDAEESVASASTEALVAEPETQTEANTRTVAATAPTVATTVAATVPEVPRVEEQTAPLVSAFDGQHTGRVQRYVAKNSADVIVLAYLPPLDMAADSYQVWLLKDGLADVQDMGSLSPRADGSWVLNFTAGPSTGIVDPRLYDTVVIMKEPKDGNPAPSGNKIAEAGF